MTLQRFLDYSDTYAPAIVLIILAMQPLKRWHSEGLFLYIYVYLAVLVFGVSNYMANLDRNNLFLYYSFLLFEMVFLGRFISASVYNPVKRRLIWILVLLYSLFLVIYILFFASIKQFDNLSLYIACLVQMFICFLYFLNLIDEEQTFSIKQNISFFVVSGFFVYASICSVAFYFYPLVNDPLSNQKDQLWLVQDIALILKYSLITLGLLWHTDTRESI